MASTISTLKTINDLSPLIMGEMLKSYHEMADMQSNWKNLFTRQVTSHQLTFTRTWLYDILRLKEQPIGQSPEYKELSGTTASFTLTEWSEAVRLSRYDTIEQTIDGALDAFSEASNMGKVVLSWYLERIVDMLENGDSTAFVMYDGENYFGNSHDRNGNAYDNLLAGALDEAGVAAARTAMAKFPSDQGEAMGALGTDIIYPFDLDITVRKVLRSATTSEANQFNENPLKGIPFNLHAVPQLTDINDWYLLHTGSAPGEKPFIDAKHSEWGDFQVYPEIDINSEAFKKYREYRWWGFMTRAMAPSHPFLAIKLVNA